MGKPQYQNSSSFWCGGKPNWLRRNLSYSKDFFVTKETLSRFRVNTVCSEAACPNIGECWSRNESTFIILGKNCSRNCLFCNVNYNLPEPSPFTPPFYKRAGFKKGLGEPVDEEEPLRIAEAVKQLELDYVTVTSVTRDDVADYGTGHFVETVKVIKRISPSIIIEILIPDMNGNQRLIEQLAESGASVIGHNIEMVERLYPLVRPQADYRRSLQVLRVLRKYSNILTKSAIMVGLGETWDEVIVTLRDLRESGVDIVHIGQYLRPSQHHFAVSKYYTPQEFEEIGEIARDLGFKAVSSGPLVRSSYNARESYLNAKENYAGCNVL